MPAGNLLDVPTTFPGLLRHAVIRRPEQQIPAWPGVPATRHRNLLLVVAQRKPRLLGRDRRSGLRIRKQQRDVVLVPPRRPLRQPAFSHGGTQELQPLGRRGSRATASLTSSATRGQNGGSSASATSTNDGTTVTAPNAASCHPPLWLKTG